jgi:hypothetical protein
MPGINSRSKGARNERLIADLFTKWTGRKFAKTPASGGLQWKSSFSKGDIVCTKEGHYFPFCIEAKSYAKIDFSHLLTPGIKNVDILTFWDQCSRDAKLCNKIPLLLMRYNGLPKGFYFLVTTQEYARSIHRFLPKDMKSLRYEDYSKPDCPPLMILRSTDFFKTNYKEIKAHAKSFIKKEIKDGNKK